MHIVEYNPVERLLSTVSKLAKVALPWRGEYGMPIRGGTPAILVNGVYLSIFHTVSMFQMPYKLKTYFLFIFFLEFINLLTDIETYLLFYSYMLDYCFVEFESFLITFLGFHLANTDHFIILSHKKIHIFPFISFILN